MRTTAIIILLIYVNVSWAQKIKVKTQCKLPPELIESSGMVTGTDNTIWTHNDSGGEACLYKLSADGLILRKVFIQDVVNTDWEDMANDYKGFVYIADIGNNLNDRKNLSILKIPHPDSVQVDTLKPEVIQFSYPNQKAFPPKQAELNFDAEAIVAYEDSLFIFTKNRTKPYSKYTYVYALKNEQGHQQAVLTDSIYLKRTHKYRSWVTGAAKHPSTGDIILISHKKAWIVKGFRIQMELERSKISGIYSQKEAVAFDKDGHIWISNEKFKFLRAKLKKGSIK
jgi:hypothetical protein